MIKSGTNFLNTLYMVVMKCQRDKKGGTLTTVMVVHFFVDHPDHIDTLVINVSIVGKYK